MSWVVGSVSLAFWKRVKNMQPSVQAVEVKYLIKVLHHKKWAVGL